MKRIVLLVALLSSAFAITHAQTGHADAVAQAKADLQSKNVSTAGACGALRIANLAAWRLRPAYALLTKAGGFRAVLRADGTCESGGAPNDTTREPGYATDYLIDRATGFGYDTLSDAGNTNGAQWNGPETDPGLVNRNFQNMHEPIDPAGYYTEAVVPPVVVPPAVDLSPIVAELAALAARVKSLEDFRSVTDTRLSVLEARPTVTGCTAALNFGAARIPLSCSVK
jgi:hypothetical protein